MATVEPAERQRMLRSAVRQLVDAECSLPQRVIMEQSADLRPIWATVAGAGWAGMLVPERLGGADAAPSEAGIVWEELGAGLVPGPHLATGVLAPALLTSPLAGDQGRRLRAIAAGELTVAFAYTEADGSWLEDAITLPARPTGTGFALRGEKCFIPDADLADELLCVARSTENGGLCIFALPRETSGVVIRPMRGWSASPLFEVQFNDVELDGQHLVGGLGTAAELLRPALETATAVLCAYMVGMAERVTESSLRYAHQRVQFGQPIARFQHVQSHLVNMRNWTDAARLCTNRALDALDGRRDDRALSVSLAKSVTSRALVDVCEAAHHLHAGIGSDKAYGLYLYTKAARTYFHYLGSPADHEERVATLLQL